MILLHLPTQIRSSIRGQRVHVVGQNLLTHQGNKHFDLHVIRSCCLKQRQIFLCQPGSNKSGRASWNRGKFVYLPASSKRVFRIFEFHVWSRGIRWVLFPSTSMFQNSLFPLGKSWSTHWPGQQNKIRRCTRTFHANRRENVNKHADTT